MGNMKFANRSQIPVEYRWDIDRMYPGDSTWERDIKAAEGLVEKILSFRGKISRSASNLSDVLEGQDKISLLIERAFVYTHMKLDEDNRSSTWQEANSVVLSRASEISASVSFITPEITAMPVAKIRLFINEEPRLNVYRHLLEDTIRQKKHILSKKEESLMANMSNVTSAPGTIFSMINDADISFGNVEDNSGNKINLTHGNYIDCMRSDDRLLRKNAYTSCYSAYKSLSNTLASVYNTSVQRNVLNAKIRKFKSARQAALSSDNIPESVYDHLVKNVNDRLPVMHSYLKGKKNILGIDRMMMYDVYVPVIKAPKGDYTFEDAISLCVEALSPLGKDYIEKFKSGIVDRWIDVYETPGKTSGAFSFGSYDSLPYILLNFDGKLEDVFTIIHEMGHSMNSFYTRSTQPYVYGDHAIFTAEVASTVNETLLMNYLLEKTESGDLRKYILNMYLEAYRTTLFRQTMFAEFENETHKYVEAGGSLTAVNLCDIYGSLNKKYFGDDTETDDYIKFEWARIPHFYNAFYVYQYATGYSAAAAIAEKILSGDNDYIAKYLDFLSSGTNDYPLEILKIAEVDMSKPEPVIRALDKFESLVDMFLNKEG